MTDQNLTQLINVVSASENTQELSNYWKNRYNDIFSRNLFKLSDKTADLLKKDQLEKPATPFGDIVLCSHLDKNGMLDEVLLQNTIETAVRFLDASLDQIKFSSQAAFVVSQYRKIGLGILDFNEYFEHRNSSSEIHEIDYIGNLVSNLAYRSSESLAEEKGNCQNWSKISLHLRPKSFEHWINQSTEELKSGLELTEDFDQETIEKSNFQIIPRRNSHILLLPPDLEWQIWSDRDETAPPTELVNAQNTENQELRPANTSQNLSGHQDNEPNHQTENPPTIFPELVNNSSDFNRQNQNPTIEQSQPSLIVSDFKTQNSVLPTQTEVEINKPDIQNELPVDAGMQKTENQDTSGTAIENLPIIEPIKEENEEFDRESEPFQIGELVQIKNPDLSEYQNVYQIIDIIDEYGENPRYRLTGGVDEFEKYLWSAGDLQPLDLQEILNKINRNTQSEKEVFSPKIILCPVVFNDDQSAVLTPHGKLPSFNLETQVDPKTLLIEKMQREYQLTLDFEDRAAVIAELSDSYQLNVAFRSELNDSSDFEWTTLNNLEKLSETEQCLISELSEPALQPEVAFSEEAEHIPFTDFEEQKQQIQDRYNQKLQEELAKKALEMEEREKHLKADLEKQLAEKLEKELSAKENELEANFEQKVKNEAEKELENTLTSPELERKIEQKAEEKVVQQVDKLLFKKSVGLWQMMKKYQDK